MALLTRFRRSEGPLENVREAAKRAAEDAASTAERIAEDVGTGASQMRKEVASLAVEVKKDVAKELAKAGRQVKLDERIDEVAKRIRGEVAPKAGLEGLVSRLQRDLPDTDKDRYDRAFQRGWTRARSSYIGIGLVLGTLGGVLGALFLDPERGAARRRQLAERVRSMTAQARSTASRQASQLQSKAQQAAQERGIGGGGEPQAHAGQPSDAFAAPAATTPGVPVMTDPLTRQPTSPGDTTAWDALRADAAGVPSASSTDAGTPVAAGTVAAEGHEVTPVTAEAGTNPTPEPGLTSETPDNDRGDWHRTI